MADLTIEILKQIRDETRATKEQGIETNLRLSETVERLDQTVERLDQTVERLDRLERRQAEAEIRVATQLTAVVGAIGELKDIIVADRDLRREIANHERRLTVIETRLG